MTHVAFYDVALACEAAPSIGCGIRAKPLLAELEANAQVARAWLSRSGTVLAVEWRAAPAEPVPQPIGATRITDAALLAEMRRELAAGRGWYRKEEIDELSEEESRVIAERLMRRMLVTVELGAERQELIRRVIAHACARVLTTSAPGTTATRERLLGDAMMQAACCELEPRERDALRQAVEAGGHRPREGEA
jgi:hypothetical protein